MSVLIVLLCEQTTLTALGEMFEAARSIMSWLGECAKVCFIYFVVCLYLVVMCEWRVTVNDLKPEHMHKGQIQILCLINDISVGPVGCKLLAF